FMRALNNEIAYFTNVWLPAHRNAQTGQADQSIYQFQSINLKISAIERIAPVLTDISTDHAPTAAVDSNLAANTVAEGAANGTTVGITASSSDVNGGTLTYSLVDNAGGRFAINASTGVVTVADGTLLDYETVTSHQITVRASDPSGAQGTDTVFT